MYNIRSNKVNRCKITTTDRLGGSNAPFEITDVRCEQTGTWNTGFANDVLQLSRDHQEDIARFALHSLQAFPVSEQTLAMARLGLPTGFFRVDGTVDETTGEIFPYECEERPGGLGLMAKVAQQTGDSDFVESMRGHLENTFGQMPVVKRYFRFDGDDAHFFGENQVSQLEFDDNGLIMVEPRPTLVRTEPRYIERAANVGDLAAQSISTVLDKGRKGYREATGHARIIHSVDELPSRNESFVLKSMQDSKTNGVKIWIANSERRPLGMGKKVPGMETETKIVDFVETHPEGVLVEPFVPGIRTQVRRQIGMTAFRVFGKVFSDHVELCDGLYTFRPNAIVHGASDSIFGLVKSPDKVTAYD